jgi:spermidine/putrescine transport system substrate-binding protein
VARGMSRREFVERSARLSIVAGLAGVGGSWLTGCGSESGGGGSADSLPLARLDQPVTLPDNGISPVAGGQDPETGTLKVLNYDAYINPDTVKAFESASGASVEITVYDTEDKLLANLRNESLSFDLVIGATTLNLPKFVVGKLIQPLNKEYLPNFSNVLSSLQSPYYDVGSAYTVPYVVYTTGIAYRRDELDDSLFAGEDAWKLLWDPAYKGFVGVIDDPREALTLGMYYRGVTDTNTGDPAIIDAAEADIKALVAATDARFDILAYQKIPENTAHINQAWSGDMVSAQYYLPEGTDVDVLGYWKPSRTTVANDFFVVPAGAERPVLAHSLIDFLLVPEQAQLNFEYVGYQPATQSPTPEDLVAAELVPSNLMSTLVTDADVDGGYRLDALSPEVEALWVDAYSNITAG